ncbi:MAG TPA: rod shape-determining protein MreC, partial [bacterium]|nr:rod shape-determining protein MreC [bacterium]
MIKYIIISLILILSNNYLNFSRINNYFYKILKLKNSKNYEIKIEPIILKQIEEIKEENKKLREIIGLKEEFKYEFSIAKIKYWEISRDEIKIVINKGKKEGIVKNKGVIIIEKNKPIVIGKINEVYEDYSKVLTILSNNFLASVKKEGDRNKEEHFLISGNGEFCYVKYFPYKYNFKIGDKILTTGNDDIFLPDFYIG